MRAAVLVVGVMVLGACTEAGEVSGEGGEMASALYGTTDDRGDPVCYPKGSVERAVMTRVGYLVPSDGTLPCSLVIVSQTSTDAAQYALSVARCRPKPGVSVTAWFGEAMVSCDTKAISDPWGYPVAFVAALEGGDAMPALYKLPGTAWGWSGLSLHPSSSVAPGTPLVVPQYDAVPGGRRVVVATHHDGGCVAGVTLGGVFGHSCDTSGANGAPEMPQGAPILAVGPSGAYDIVGLHVGQAGGGNVGVNLGGLAPLLALVPHESAAPLD